MFSHLEPKIVLVGLLNKEKEEADKGKVEEEEQSEKIGRHTGL
jgi:hypothetical protein